MIVVVGALRLSESGLQRVSEAAREVVRETRGEPGCIAYDFAVDLAEPGLIRIYEEWESREALARHGQTAHIARWREALAELDQTDLDLKLVEVAGFEAFS